MEEAIVCVSICWQGTSSSPASAIHTLLIQESLKKAFLLPPYWCRAEAGPDVMLRQAEPSPSFMLSGFSPGALEESSGNSTPSQFATSKCVS